MGYDSVTNFYSIIFKGYLNIRSLFRALSTSIMEQLCKESSNADVWESPKYIFEFTNQPAFTCSKLTTETVGQGGKYVQS